MAGTLAERRGLTLDHSREWLRYVGMERAIDGLEGEPEIVAEAREVLTAGARRIADEIRLSIEYYHTTVPDARRVELTVMAGPGIAIEGLPAFFETELGMPVQPRSMGQVEVEPGALDGVEAAELDDRHRACTRRGAELRPINLIPAEQRRGSGRGAGGRPRFNGYIVLGALGAAVLCALGVVMTSNQINSKTEELATIQADSQREKQVADALRPYGQFADLQRARMTQIKTVAESRYDWERPLRQLSRAIPRNVLAAVRGRYTVGGRRRGCGRRRGRRLQRENKDAPAFAITAAPTPSTRSRG